MSSQRQTGETLAEAEAGRDPFTLFGRWLKAAREAGLVEPTAMTLATASRDGAPSARMVLLKGFDPEGFVFFTNYESAKARDLEANPEAAAVFWWGALERQVRLNGPVSRVSGAESDAYFQSRPVGSRFGAIASRQSSVIAGRDELERRVEALQRQYAGGTIPRPAHWGGYRLAPRTIEFWQGRPDRLHDRLRYTRGGSGNWTIDRLSP